MGIRGYMVRSGFNELRLGAVVLRLGYDFGGSDLNARKVKVYLDDAGDVCILIGMDNEFRSMKPSERKELVQIWLGEFGWDDQDCDHIKWTATLQGITSWNAYTPRSAGCHVAWVDLDWVDGALVITSTGKRFEAQ